MTEKHDAKKAAETNYLALAEKADAKILSLFPTFSTDGKSIQRNAIPTLACIYAIGDGEFSSPRELAKTLNATPHSTARTLKKLLSLSLVAAAKDGRTVKYSLTAKGVIALESSAKYRGFSRIRPLLSTSKNRDDQLAYALLVIGYSANGKDDVFYDALTKYAAQGRSLELLEGAAAAESLLNFYQDACMSEAKSPLNYLGVFKEFTSSGFQDIFRMLLSAMKPTVEDYNWLVQFFHEVVAFYYDPVRVAYMNVLAQNSSLRSRLEQFKKTQETSAKTSGSQMELTFKVTPSKNLEQIMRMPPHLKVISMRLMLEPLEFMNQELKNFFWPN